MTFWIKTQSNKIPAAFGLGLGRRPMAGGLVGCLDLESRHLVHSGNHPLETCLVGAKVVQVCSTIEVWKGVLHIRSSQSYPYLSLCRQLLNYAFLMTNPSFFLFCLHRMWIIQNELDKGKKKGNNSWMFLNRLIQFDWSRIVIKRPKVTINNY